MSRRPGRKRNVPVTKVGGDPPMETTIERTSYPIGIDNRDRVIDGKAVTLISRLTVLEAILAGVDEIRRKRLDMAAQELCRLYHLCRRFASDAPPINAKTSSLNSGHGHEPTDDRILSLGVKVHKRYQDGIRAFNRDRVMISAVVSVCLRNEIADKDLTIKGLGILADFYGF